MNSSRSENVGKGILYIIALIVWTVISVRYLSNDALLIHIPLSGFIREIFLAASDGFFILGFCVVFLFFACPGWLFSQLIFKGDHEVRSFAIYTSAPPVIITIVSFIGYLTIDEGSFLFTAQDLFVDFMLMAAFVEAPVIILFTKQ